MGSKRKTAKRKVAAPKTKAASTRSAAARRAKKATGAKPAAAKRAAAKKAGARSAAKRPAARVAGGRTVARRPVAKRPVARKAAARKGARAPEQRSPAPPQPPAQDEVVLSGVWGPVRYSESDPDAEVKEIFGHYDRDRSGQINASELARILEALGMELEEHELKVALLDVDRDQDGKIGWDEFLPWWRSMAS